MEQKLLCGCVEVLQTSTGEPVTINGRRLMLQTPDCIKDHGPSCLNNQAGGSQLAPRLWVEEAANAADDVPEFSFTREKVMLDATCTLHTEFGRLRCVPDAEYALWRKAGYCDVTPLVLHLDDVTWRVIACENATADDSGNADLPDDIAPAFRLYLRAFREGGALLEEVQEAVRRGEQDLKDHREFLFKVFSIVSMPPTLSHDLSKTKLVNFALGRCFSSDDLKVLQAAVSFEDCMALVKRLHLEVENHHPEHGARPALSLLDMYLDRVSRGVQKTHGWNQAAWSIPERFAPPAYRQDFASLEKQYGHLELKDPGELHLPEVLPGARLQIKWENVRC